MKIALFLLISTLFYFGYSNSSDERTTMYKSMTLIKEFSQLVYEYRLLSMTLLHSDVAFQGMSKLVNMLAEEKREYVDKIMSYMVSRNAHEHFIHSLTVKHVNWAVLNYTMTPELSLNFILDNENSLIKKLNDVIPYLDIHATHFFQHTIMEAQYDCFSRIQNLYSKVKKGTVDPVYLYEFDRSVNFLYHNFFLVPKEVSI